MKIGHVASILGVSTARIRLWEHEGLIAPTRTASGQRRYTAHELERMESIRDLLETKAMTIAGVRAHLDDRAEESRPSPLPIDESANPVGDRAKAFRRAQGMSLRYLADATGISPSALSAFERGLSKPNTGRISKIAHTLGTTVAELLGTPVSEDRVVVRVAEREALPIHDAGVKIELLYQSRTALQAQSLEMEPGCGLREAMSHSGVEFIMVISGEVELVLDNIEIHQLGTGDSAMYASNRPHRFANPGVQPAHFVLVNTPPTF